MAAAYCGRPDRFCLRDRRGVAAFFLFRGERRKRFVFEADSAGSRSVADGRRPLMDSLASRGRIDTPFAGPALQKIASLAGFGQSGERRGGGNLDAARGAAHAPIIGSDLSRDVRFTVRTPHSGYTHRVEG